MGYLNSKRNVEIAYNTTMHLEKVFQKFRNTSSNFEVNFKVAFMQTSHQFHAEIPERINRHFYFVDGLFNAYSYIGPNTLAALGDELLDVIGTMLKEAFSTTEEIKRVQTIKELNTWPIVWKLCIGIDAPGFPENNSITLGIFTPKSQLYWLQDIIGDYPASDAYDDLD